MLVQLLELYSTQSCSSCPPAQEWVLQLKDHPELWKKFVPVVYHVDYWDYLGWKDPYSNAKYTQRQKAYADAWSSNRIYTPMFVLDAKEWRARKPNELIKQRKTKDRLRASERPDQSFEVEFQCSETGDLILHSAILGNDIETNVKAGENRGKKLKHGFLVLEANHRPLTKKKGIYKARVHFSEKAKQAKNKSVVFWVQQKQGLKILQTLGANWEAK